MIRQLSRSIREYKMYAILAPLMMVGEVAMEVLIPTLMAGFMDSGVKTSDMSFVLRQGGGLLLCAMASLCFGILSATFASRAAAGFAKNLRQDMGQHRHYHLGCYLTIFAKATSRGRL